MRKYNCYIDMGNRRKAMTDRAKEEKDSQHYYDDHNCWEVSMKKKK